MKKVLALIIVLTFAIVLVACEDDSDNSQPNVNNPNNYTTSNNEANDELGIRVYRDADFMEVAGYKVIKDNSISDIKYNNILLNADGNSQLDLQLADGKLATLLVKKVADYVDDEQAEHIAIGDYEVRLVKGIDNINTYYWNKDDTSYVLSVSNKSDFSNDELLKIINGFSINAGDNY